MDQHGACPSRGALNPPGNFKHRRRFYKERAFPFHLTRFLRATGGQNDGEKGRITETLATRRSGIRFFSRIFAYHDDRPKRFCLPWQQMVCRADKLPLPAGVAFLWNAQTGILSFAPSWATMCRGTQSLCPHCWGMGVSAGGALHIFKKPSGFQVYFFTNSRYSLWRGIIRGPGNEKTGPGLKKALPARKNHVF